MTVLFGNRRAITIISLLPKTLTSVSCSCSTDSHPKSSGYDAGIVPRKPLKRCYVITLKRSRRWATIRRLGSSLCFSELRSKIAEYFAIGVERVWVVEPEKKQLLVYRTPTDFTQLTEQETVRREGILAGFALPLQELFAGLP